jgi:hypothetical protein
MMENLRQIEWLNKEKQKDNLELEQQKKMLIENIKKHKKEDILPQKPKKLTIWQRIMKVLMG